MATPCRIHADRPATHVRQYRRRGFQAWDLASIGTEHLCASCAVQAERATGVRAVEIVAAERATGIACTELVAAEKAGAA